MQKFIGEDDIQTFEGWLRYQNIDTASSTQEVLVEWRKIFGEVVKTRLTRSKMGLMKFHPIPGEYRYAVAVREESGLWLTLWVRRSRKGEFFIMIPRGDQGWDPHTSYHLDGTMHMKSYHRKVLPPQKFQPLTDKFRGSEHLGVYYGHAPKSVGANCDPTAFSGVVDVPPGVLGLTQGGVTVDLVEPGQNPRDFAWTQVVKRQVFRDFLPWVVITVGLPNTDFPIPSTNR